MMGHLVDVHILRYSGECERYIPQCLESLEEHPIVVHQHFNPDPPAIGRIRGYLIGNLPYVSYVDSDDFIPESDVSPFKILVDFLDNNQQYVAAYTNSMILNEKSGMQHKMFNHDQWTREFHDTKIIPVHQLIVIRRQAIEKIQRCYLRIIKQLPQHAGYYDQILYALVSRLGPIKFFPDVVGYVWRRHNNNHSKIEPSSERKAIKQQFLTQPALFQRCPELLTDRY